MSNTLAYIKYPDGHSARIAIVDLIIMSHGVVSLTDINGKSYTTHMSNVVIEQEDSE